MLFCLLVDLQPSQQIRILAALEIKEQNELSMTLALSILLNVDLDRDLDSMPSQKTYCSLSAVEIYRDSGMSLILHQVFYRMAKVCRFEIVNERKRDEVPRNKQRVFWFWRKFQETTEVFRFVHLTG
jgi:hypothetical protein